jgi:hypothetical protein
LARQDARIFNFWNLTGHENIRIRLHRLTCSLIYNRTTENDASVQSWLPDTHHATDVERYAEAANPRRGKATASRTGTIMVMQAAHHRLGNDPATFWWSCHGWSRFCNLPRK